MRLLPSIAILSSLLAAYSLRSTRPIAAGPRTQETVRTELVRLQHQTGLSLGTFGFGFELVLFDKRDLFRIPLPTGFSLVQGTFSHDGTEIMVSRFDAHASDSLELLSADASKVRDIPLPQASGAISYVESLCWSHDKSRLAMGVHHGSQEIKLEILNLSSGAVLTLDPSVGLLASQCWSPDDKSIVYEAGDGVRTYDFGNEKHSLLEPGGKAPTWSPDGSWIAYREGDTFYEIRPDGRDKKKLFHRKDVYTPLSWSPDSRFVAYVSLARFALDDVYELRARRLADNSEDRLAEGQISGIFNWLISPGLVTQARTSKPSP